MREHPRMREFLKDKNKHLDQRKEKLPPHTSCENEDNLSLTITNSLTSKLADFWRVYDELGAEQPHNPGSTMYIDKNTVEGEDLKGRPLKYALRNIVAPYLINIRKLSYEVTLSIISGWQV